MSEEKDYYAHKMSKAEETAGLLILVALTAAFIGLFVSIVI